MLQSKLEGKYSLESTDPRVMTGIPEATLARNVRRILFRGPMPPWRLRRRKFWKFDYEMVHSEIYLNKYVVSIAPFSTPACPRLLSKYNINIENCSFCVFLIFHPFFQGGGWVSWPYLPLCADAHGARARPCSAVLVLAKFNDCAVEISE